MLRKKGTPHDYTCYTFGKDNHKLLSELGIKSVLIDPDPAPYNLIECQYKHKFVAIQYAMEEDGYDEVLHLDWDAIPVKQLPWNMWDIFGKKESVQACLQQYRAVKCGWRRKDRRKVCNGGGLYIRDKSFVSNVLKIREEMGGPSIEPPMMRYFDNYYGQWIGKIAWWKLHEPELIRLRRGSAYAKDPELVKDWKIDHYV